MAEFFITINDFLNEPQTLKVLYALVLIMALVWMLSGGLRFLNKPKDRDKQDS
jgi:hypothetical protein